MAARSSGRRGGRGTAGRCWREQSGSATRGGFTIQSWTQRTALGERAIDVDQTNESVIVGDAAVVKWATHLQEGPHPAPRRIAVLRDAGFDGMPTPWGLVTWRSVDGAETLAASVDEYLPGAVDGWTWAVGLITAPRVTVIPTRVSTRRAQVGSLVAEYARRTGRTVTVASAGGRRAMAGRRVRNSRDVCALPDSRASPWPASVGARSRRSWTASACWRTLPSSKGTATSTSVRCCAVTGRSVVTDFDGNPSCLRTADAADSGRAGCRRHGAVAGARRDRRGKYTDLDPAALAEVDAAVANGIPRCVRG